MKPVRYAVIGLGFFGEKHVEVLSDMLGVELAAVCTRRPDRLKEIAGRFRVPKTFTNYADLLADPAIDAVSIVTHVNDHREIAVAALAAGKHVFLEKPMAGTLADCDWILAAAKSAPCAFMVGHICRFDPRFALAKSAIDEGRIGRIVSMHATRNLPAPIGAEVLDKISPLLGDGIHDTDLMLWFTRDSVRTVYAQTVRVRNFKFPDIAWAVYRFAGGAVGVIETIWALPATTPYTIDARMEIVGTEGALYVDCSNPGLTINDAKGLHKPDTVYWPNLFSHRVGVLRLELSYFVDCLARGKTPDVITPEESRLAVRTILAAEESAETGKVISL
ncbi:MAG: Gfo/Idh/MocA family oxidoreductase [Planctomycetota bacterium]